MNDFSLFPVTFSIIGITVLVSFLAFNNNDLRNKLLFYPYGMTNANQYYRFIGHGLIHAYYIHLLFNMFTLYSFGRAIEYDSPVSGQFLTSTQYVIFYVTALVASSIYDFIKNKNYSGYAALGASGAVSAVVFATLVVDPWHRGVAIFGIPDLALPNIAFAVLYLWYCIYMSKRGKDNIGHNAHFWGSVYGLVFMFVLKPALLKQFIEKLMNPHF